MKTLFDTFAAVVLGLAFTALPIDLSAFESAAAVSRAASSEALVAQWAGPLAGPVGFTVAHSDAIKALIILFAAVCHVALLLAEARKARAENKPAQTLRLMHLAVFLWCGLVTLQIVLLVEHGMVTVGA